MGAAAVMPLALLMLRMTVGRRRTRVGKELKVCIANHHQRRRQRTQEREREIHYDDGEVVITLL